MYYILIDNYISNYIAANIIKSIKYTYFLNILYYITCRYVLELYHIDRYMLSNLSTHTHNSIYVDREYNVMNVRRTYITHILDE